MHGVTTIDRGNPNWFGCWAVCPHPSPPPPAESGLWISPKATRELSRLWRIVRNFSHTDISYLLHLLWLVYMILAKYWSSSLTLNKSWSLTPWEEGTLGYFVMKTMGIPFALLRGANCSVWSYLLHKYQASPRISGRTGVKYESSAFIHYFHRP